MMDVFSLSISQITDTSDDLSSSDDSDIEVTPTKNDDEDIQNRIAKDADMANQEHTQMMLKNRSKQLKLDVLWKKTN